jgi:hypothetical protein
MTIKMMIISGDVPTQAPQCALPNPTSLAAPEDMGEGTFLYGRLILTEYYFDFTLHLYYFNWSELVIVAYC